MEIVSAFSAGHLSEHLLYVVENVSVDMHLEKSPEMSPIRGSKDVRAQLYSRIGVTKAKGEGQTDYTFVCVCSHSHYQSFFASQIERVVDIGHNFQNSMN